MGPNIQKFRAGAVTSESFIDNMMLTKPQHEFYNSIRTLSKMFIRLKPDELPKDSNTILNCNCKHTCALILNVVPAACFRKNWEKTGRACDASTTWWTFHK